MAWYGQFIPNDNQFADLNPLHQKSGSPVDNVLDYEATISDALDVLERDGRLHQPAYR